MTQGHPWILKFISVLQISSNVVGISSHSLVNKISDSLCPLLPRVLYIFTITVKLRKYDS